jgi:hypothetical protein
VYFGLFRGDIEMHRHGSFALPAELREERVAHQVDDLGIDQGPTDFGKFENAHEDLILAPV